MGEGLDVVGTDHLGRPAQRTMDILESLLQGQEGLASDHPGVTPARVAQHQMEQQVAVGLASDGDSQGVAVVEVDLGLTSRGMLLREVDFLVRPV